MPTPISPTDDDSGRLRRVMGGHSRGRRCGSGVDVVLLVLAASVGLSTVSPWTGAAVSATTFKVTAGLTLVAIAMISSTVGGYMAGRLRSLWTGAHSEEVLFRDTAHGFLAWCTATVAGVLILGAATTVLVGGTAAGLSASAGQAAVRADGLLRRHASASGTRRAAGTAGARRQSSP